MALIPSIKDNDWVSVRQAIQKLATTKLGTKATPTYAEISVQGNATVSTLDAVSAVISAGSFVSLNVQSLTVTSVYGFADCIAVNSLPAGSNYQFVFHIPDIHFYVFG